MLKLTWHNEEVPKGMRVGQVYGVIFTQDGRTLLKVDTKADGRKVYAIAGGTPEDFDADRIATLRRELVEEVNTTIGDEIYYVGYQEVSGDGEKLITRAVEIAKEKFGLKLTSDVEEFV